MGLWERLTRRKVPKLMIFLASSPRSRTSGIRSAAGIYGQCWNNNCRHQTQRKWAMIYSSQALWCHGAKSQYRRDCCLAGSPCQVLNLPVRLKVGDIRSCVCCLGEGGLSVCRMLSAASIRAICRLTAGHRRKYY